MSLRWYGTKIPVRSRTRLTVCDLQKPCGLTGTHVMTPLHTFSYPKYDKGNFIYAARISRVHRTVDYSGDYHSTFRT